MRHPTTTILLGLILLLAACGGAGDADDAGAVDDTTSGPTSTPSPTGTSSPPGTSSEDAATGTQPAPSDPPSDPGVGRDEAAAVVRAYLGLTEAEAEEQARTDDRPLRVGARDGEQMMLTEDYVVGRITIELTDGVVTGATVESTDGEVSEEDLDPSSDEEAATVRPGQLVGLTQAEAIELAPDAVVGDGGPGLPDATAPVVLELLECDSGPPRVVTAHVLVGGDAWSTATADMDC